MAGFFGATMFVSALLLFLVQPMIGKMILPLMGGTPAVWNTCMVFFQALLLAGYTYAHVSTRMCRARAQARLHLAVLGLPLIVLAAALFIWGEPIHVVRSLAPQGSEYPFFGLVVLLTVTIGVPFFVVSTTAPLLQRWYADTDRPDAADPYFLYGASNFGSLLGLSAYPLLMEPALRLSEQGWTWAAGYAVLAALTWGCAARLWRTPRPRKEIEAHDSAPTWGRRIRWLLLSFAPSSLLLGATTFATTDIAPIPLLWVVPLALYLTTFIIAFGRPPKWVRTATALAAPILLLMLMFMTICGMITDLKLPKFWMTLVLHFTAFFFAALSCHLELVRLRPTGSRSTEFYLVMSLGGVLGGLFNALVAPLVFKDLTEYPIAVILACVLLPQALELRPVKWRARVLDFAIPILVFGLILLLEMIPTSTFDFEWQKRVSAESIWTLVVIGIPCLIVYYGVDRPLRFGLGVGVIWLAMNLFDEGRQKDSRLLRDRSFFGRLQVGVKWVALRSGPIEGAANESPIVIKSPGHGLATGQTVTQDAIEFPKGDDNGSWTVTVLDNDHFRLDDSKAFTEFKSEGKWTLLGRFHELVHGTTLHGKQQFNPPSDEPLTYYHRTGPLGQVFQALQGIENQEVAAVGLGTGSVAAYGQKGMRIDFYEIDQAVRRIAENPEYFTYLKGCRDRGCDLDIVMGDARLKLDEHGRDGQYRLIVLDAFSSDAIPIHLLTKEAVQMYFGKLRLDGVLALHVSNRYLSLEPIAARIAKELNLVGLRIMDGDQDLPGKQSSQWVVLARTSQDFGTLSNQPDTITYQGRSFERKDDWKWKDLEVTADIPLWSDDFSNILSVLSWW